jgi:hypothetical protein
MHAALGKGMGETEESQYIGWIPHQPLQPMCTHVASMTRQSSFPSTSQMKQPIARGIGVQLVPAVRVNTHAHTHAHPPQATMYGTLFLAQVQQVQQISLIQVSGCLLSLWQQRPWRRGTTVQSVSRTRVPVESLEEQMTNDKRC